LVNIPKAHKFGSVGSAWWKRWTRLSVDDRMRVHAVLPATGEQEFLDSIDQELSLLDPHERTVLVYVHGYATTFNQAAVRAAQIGFDLKIDGPTAFFSWPSAGQMVSYPRDANAIEASEPNLEHFLLALADSTQATRVNLIAHSMGNRLLARSIQGLAAKLSGRGIKLGTVILAAPDIDVRLFKQLAAAYPSVSQNTTMYVSERDKALALSRSTWRAARAGFTPPVTVVPGIHTIEVRDIDVSRLGHGYYAAAAPVLHDIRALLDGQFDPSKRLRLKERSSGPAAYWYFAK
jgi:esterase/lipase superfamily enzyme